MPHRTKRDGSDEAREDAALLRDYDPAAFPRPSVAVDVALVTISEDRLATLLVRRREAPQRGRWALPGTFLRLDETLEAAAERALRDKTGIERPFLEQLYTFGDPKRDPRMRVLSVAYVALVDPARLVLDPARAEEVGVFSIEVPWEGETGGPVSVLDEDGEALALAFDHDLMLGMVVKRLRGKLGYTPIGYQLLAERFTLAALQHVHETVLGRPLNKDSFRRRMLSTGELEATGERQEGAHHRPAELYRFIRRSAV